MCGFCGWVVGCLFCYCLLRFVTLIVLFICFVDVV